MYVQLDVEWPGNRKRIRAGLEASAIHAITLCLAKRSQRDGWVARDELALYGSTDDLIDRLEEVGLLDADEEWVRPHDWLEVNLSSERIRLEKADKARAANHARWHEGPYEACDKCKQKARSSEPDPDGVRMDPTSSLTGSEQDKEEQQQATDPESRRAVLEAAAAIIGAKAGARPTADNPAAVAAAVARGVVRDRYQDAYRLLAENPALTAQELANALEPEQATKPHVLDGQLQAQSLIAERNRLRLIGEACGNCDGAGWYLDDTNEAVRCECSQAVGA